MSKKLTQEFALAKLNEQRGNVIDFTNTIFHGTHSNITAKCRNCGVMFETPYKVLLQGFKYGCESCSRKGGGRDWTNKIAEKQISIMKRKRGEYLNFSKAIYTGDLGKIIVICKKCNKEETVKYSALKPRSKLEYGCTTCTNKEWRRQASEKRTILWKKKLKKYNTLFYLDTLEMYSNNYVKIKCRSCNKFYKIYAPDLLRVDHYQYGCGNCSRKATRIAQDVYVADCIKKHKGLYTYNNTIYNRSEDDVIITCPIHGDFEQRASSHKRGAGCPTCKNSKAELDIGNWLRDNNITYRQQHKFGDCVSINTLPFDFYLPELGILIEAHGEQHYKFIKYFFKIIENFHAQQMRDKIKEDYANKNYKFLVIPYWEFDKINEVLNNYFNKPLDTASTL